MVEWKITRRLLRQLLQAAKSVYPNEYISLLAVSEEHPNLVSEFVILPAEFGWTHSSIRSDLAPVDETIVGTVHSHPSPSTRASPEDKDTFSRLGRFHLILGHPYTESSFSAYDARGKKIPVQIVD